MKLHNPAAHAKILDAFFFFSSLILLLFLFLFDEATHAKISALVHP